MIVVSGVVYAELIENLLDYGFLTFSMVQVYFYGKVVLSDINRFSPLHILRNVVVQTRQMSQGSMGNGGPLIEAEGQFQRDTRK